MAKEIYEPKYGFYHDPLTNRVICMCCFDGKHADCIKGDCRCLHHFQESRRRVKKDATLQQDMSSFGTIEVKP